MDVVLIGGGMGGAVVPGDGWAIGDAKEINGCLYRRDTDNQAVFVGMA